MHVRQGQEERTMCVFGPSLSHLISDKIDYGQIDYGKSEMNRLESGWIHSRNLIFVGQCCEISELIIFASTQN